MYEIDMDQMSPAFFRCWRAAGLHLSRQVDDGIQSWLRSHPYPPFLEHLSFRLGNQLFFVRIEDVDGQVHGPGTRRALAYIAREMNGWACLLLMGRRPGAEETWVAELPGWGLLDVTTGEPVDPVALVTDEKIEMTPWEIQDMAVQVVRGHLEDKGLQLMSWQSNPGVDPSIWFVGPTQKAEWVVVRPARFPTLRAERPDNWGEIAASCAHLGTAGHFASVEIASGSQPRKSADETLLPLWRGHSLNTEFAGLE